MTINGYYNWPRKTYFIYKADYWWSHITFQLHGKHYFIITCSTTINQTTLSIPELTDKSVDCTSILPKVSRVLFTADICYWNVGCTPALQSKIHRFYKYDILGGQGFNLYFYFWICLTYERLEMQHLTI